MLTSRNSLRRLRSALARLNPDLIASNEGGSNLTLVRDAAGTIAERRQLELRPGPRPERRAMALTRIRGPDSAALCVANLHASAGPARRRLAEQEVMLGAERAVEWAAGDPLIFGGDLNLRPTESPVFERLEQRHGLRGATAPDALDHLLSRGLGVAEPARPWPPERREIDSRGLALRLSDHGPVEAAFAPGPGGEEDAPRRPG